MVLVSYTGDTYLSPLQRAAYLLSNAVDNRFPYHQVDVDLAIADFQCDEALERLDGISGIPSPSRAMSDLFWMDLPWAALEQALGPLRMLDLGCGSGRYAAQLAAWSEQRITRYVGLDIRPHPNWSAVSSELPFVEFRAANVEHLGIPSGTNLVISQSALEHVADDRASLEAIHAYAHRQGSPLLQIHLVPSAACLRLYLWHGYRQYTPRRLSRLTSSFADCSERRLVRLGGSACNALHSRFITYPLIVLRRGDDRQARPGEYREALATAVAHDMRGPQRSPAFYALLIYSNGQGPLPESRCWRAVA